MSIHNKIYAMFGKVKKLPNYTTYKNVIIISPTHIQIITKNKIYYVKNTKINLTRINYSVFNEFTKIDKTKKFKGR